MIDENKLLKDIENEFVYYDKDGRQISPDKFSLRVSDVMRLINKQESYKPLTPPIIVTRTTTEIMKWEDIKIAADAGNLKSVLKSGDKIPLTLLNGDEVDLVVGYDENGRGYFIFDKAMSERHTTTMEDEYKNTGGYAVSKMAQYADKVVFEMLPGYLQEMIVPTTIVQNWGGERRETKHKLFCLSYTQVFGKKDKCLADREPEDTQIDIFKDVKARIKVRAGEDRSSWWWLRSSYYGDYIYFVCIDGTYNYYYTDSYGSVVLGFCIEPNQ